MTDSSNTPSFTVLEGEAIEPRDLPFSLPTCVQEHPGVRVIYRPGLPPLYEYEYEALSTMKESEMTSIHALLWLEVHGEHAVRTQGEAARLLLERFQARGRLTPGRRRILIHAQEVEHTARVRAYDMAGWLELWWPSLRSYA